MILYVTIDGQETNAKITNVTVNDATDYVTRLIYSVELELESTKVLPTNPLELRLVTMYKIW